MHQVSPNLLPLPEPLCVSIFHINDMNPIMSFFFFHNVLNPTASGLGEECLLLREGDLNHSYSREVTAQLCPQMFLMAHSQE